MGKRVCPICGYQDEENASYCKKCGAKMTESGDDTGSANRQEGQYSGYQDYTGSMSYQQPVDYGSDKEVNGLQIAGLVCGILAICSCCCYGVPAVILGVAGLVCASMGNKRSKNGVGTGGFICSIVGLVLGVIATIYYVWAIKYLAEIGYWTQFMDSL